MAASHPAPKAPAKAFGIDPDQNRLNDELTKRRLVCRNALMLRLISTTSNWVKPLVEALPNGVRGSARIHAA